jgi:hypothetical protein
MKDDGKWPSERPKPANDHPASGSGTETWQRLDQVVLDIARLIGRQMAREDFERLHAANDGRAPGSGVIAFGHDPSP